MDDILGSPLSDWIIGIAFGFPLWVLFGLIWWAKRAGRDFLDDADWHNRTAVERSPSDEAAISDEAKPSK
jgi:hypothetical protein